MLWALLGMALLVALVGALAVNRLQAAALVGATDEARNVARVVDSCSPQAPVSRDQRESSGGNQANRSARGR